MDEWALISNDRVIKRFTISEGQCLTIGRDREADIVINNSAISRKQTSLELMGGRYHITDLHSLNGTKVNGNRITATMAIKKSDFLEVGKFILKPAELLKNNEEDAKSVAAVASSTQDSFDKTLYVSGIYKNTQLHKQKAAKKDRTLSVLSGSVTPSGLVLKGKKPIKAGLKPSCDLVLSGLLVGSIQFHIVYRKEGYFIVNHDGFHRSTLVNGKKLKTEQKLKSMDIIQVGDTKIRFY